MKPPETVSVVIPVYNEAPNVAAMHRDVTGVLETLGRPWELVLADDGSRDGTAEMLDALAEKDPRIVVIHLRKNFGQTAALTAGFDNSTGDVVVTMDADLQNDPKDIPALLAKLDEGFDIVAGWRKHRKDPFISRKLPSKIANRLISWTTGVRLHDYGCTLKAFRREVIASTKLYGEMHRFIPAVASWMGVTVAEMAVNHRPRTAGKSKYGIDRTIRVVLDLITVKFLLSYSTRPIQIFGLVGFVSGAIGSGILLLLAVQRLFFAVPLANRPLLLLGILLCFIGVQFVTMGLLAELMTRIYHETLNKPIYVVKSVRKRLAERS
jgi:glycosyltransferase involved in cell wall biosynthesis